MFAVELSWLEAAGFLALALVPHSVVSSYLLVAALKLHLNKKLRITVELTRIRPSEKPESRLELIKSPFFSTIQYKCDMSTFFLTLANRYFRGILNLEGHGPDPRLTF